jgi:adenylate kinase
MKLPESAVAGTRYTEEILTKRLEEFKRNNTDESTVLNYFDEMEIHPVALSVEFNEINVFDQMLKTIGSPRNYGPSAEQIATEKAEKELARVYQLTRENRNLPRNKIDWRGRRMNLRDTRMLFLNGTRGSSKYVYKNNKFFTHKACLYART